METVDGGRYRAFASSTNEQATVGRKRHFTIAPSTCREAVRRAVSLLALAVFFWPGAAMAYRPFDGTDAGVAAPKEFELELGPVHYFREGDDNGIIVPALIANFGLEGDREIVLEGKLRRLFNNSSGDHRTSVVDTALSLKQVHRRGSLQEGAGPSVASECGILLPTLHGESGSGLACAGIVSQRWSAATVHLNGLVGRTRGHEWNRFIGIILEGPFEWRMRPVMEVFNERDTAGSWTNSALIGAIWRSRENLSFDLGIREARSNGPNITEVRVGFTWAF